MTIPLTPPPPKFSELKTVTTHAGTEFETTSLDFDKDGNATVWERELGRAFNDHFTNPNEKQQAYERLLAIVDDGDGKISRDEIETFQRKVGNDQALRTFPRNIFDYIPDAFLNGRGVATKGRLTLEEGETVNKALGLESLDDVFAVLESDGFVKRNNIRNFINTSLKAKGIERYIGAGRDIAKLIKDAKVNPHKGNFTQEDLRIILTHVENRIATEDDLFSFIDEDTTTV